jgi:hypothetical protein
MEELDLLDYLIPELKIYSVIHRTMKTVLRIEPQSDFPIVVGTRAKGNRPMFFNRHGSVLKNGKECLLFPDKETTTWEGYVTPSIHYQGDIVKAFTVDAQIRIAIYSHFDKEKQLHCCFHTVSEDGKVEYSEHNKVEKFGRKECDGYFYTKKIFSKMTVGKFKKNNLGTDEQVY